MKNVSQRISIVFWSISLQNFTHRTKV